MKELKDETNLINVRNQESKIEKKDKDKIE